MIKNKIVSSGGRKYLLGVELYSIMPASDFPSNGEGFHLAYASTRYEPVTVHFVEGNAAYGFRAREAGNSEELKGLLNNADRQQLEILAVLQPPKPDYKQWQFIGLSPL